MANSALSESVESILASLRNAQQKASGAQQLKLLVETSARELSSETFSYFEEALLRRIFDMVHSQSVDEKRGAVAAMAALIDVASAAAETKVIKFANTFKHMVTANSDSGLLEDVASALGLLARSRSTYVGPNKDYMDFELNRGLEWLAQANDTAPRACGAHRRLWACLVLRELATHTPTLFFVKTPEFFEGIWPVIRDTQRSIREAAAGALSAALRVLGERQSSTNLRLHFRTYDQIVRGFEHGGETKWVHGSLLAVMAMLEHAPLFMLPRFDSTCRHVLGCTEPALLRPPRFGGSYSLDNRSLLKLTVAKVLPRLATLCPDALARSYLTPALANLTRCAHTQRAEVRAAALLALGDLAAAVGHYLAPQLPQLIELVKDGMQSTRRREAVPREALRCVAQLVQALPEEMSPVVPGLLDTLFACTGNRLSEALMETLATVSAKLPLHEQMVQARLLGELTAVLGGVPYVAELGQATLGYRQQQPKHLRQKDRQAADKHKEANHNLLTATSNTTAKTTGGGGGGVGWGGWGGELGGGGGWGGPAVAWSPDESRMQQVLALGAQSCHCEEKALLLLSLKTLGSFRVDVSLLPFMHKCLLRYLEHKDTELRAETLVACCRLVVHDSGATAAKAMANDSPSAAAATSSSSSPPPPPPLPPGVGSRGIQGAMGPCGPSSLVVHAILRRLLQVAIRDPSVRLRRTLLAEIVAAGSGLDHWLRQPFHLANLLLFLDDEDMEVRRRGIDLLGKHFAALNPGFLMPPLRQHLKKLVLELKMSSSVEEGERGAEEAAQLLCHLVKAQPLRPLVRPLMRTLVVSLPLWPVQAKLALVGLELLGELCLVYDMHAYLDRLMPVILETMADQSSATKREVSLRTLGRLVSSTGCVVTPYLEYPELLPRILQMLREDAGNLPWSLKGEILRTLGVLGALDPDKFDMADRLHRQAKAAAASTSTQASVQSQDEKDALRRLKGEPGSANKAGGSLESSQLGGQPRAVGSMAATEVGDAATTSAAPDAGTEEKGKHAASSAQAELLLSNTVLDEDDECDGDSAPAHGAMYEMSYMCAQPSAREGGGKEGLLGDSQRCLESNGALALTPASEDYTPRVAVSALMRILKDESLSAHHAMVSQAVMHIFQNLPARALPSFLDFTLPPLLHACRRCDPSLRESLLLQLGALTAMVRSHLHGFLPQLFDLADDFFEQHTEQVHAPSPWPKPP